MDKKARILEVIYLLYLGMVTISTILMTTTIDYSSLGRIIYCILSFLAIIVIGKVALEWNESWNVLDIMKLIFGVCCLIPGMLINNNNILIFYVIAIIGAKNINYKKIFYVYGSILLLMTIFTVGLTAIGILPNVTTYRYDGAMPRYAFGFLYTTYFSAYITAIISLWAFFRNTKIRYWEVIIMALMSASAFYFTNARINFLSSAIIVATLVIFLLIRKFKNEFEILNISFIKFGLILSSAIMALVSILFGVLSYDSSLMTKVNSILSGRPGVNALSLQRYPLSFWGQKVVFHCDIIDGMNELPSYYYIINNSYIEVLCMLGVAGLFGCILMWTCISNKIAKNKEIIRLMILVSYTCLFFFEQRLTQININPFFLLLFCNYGEDENKFTDLINKTKKIKPYFTFAVIAVLIEIAIFNVQSITTILNQGMPDIIMVPGFGYDEITDTFVSEDKNPSLEIVNFEKNTDIEGITLDFNIYTLEDNGKYRLKSNMLYEAQIYVWNGEEYVLYKSAEIKQNTTSTYYIPLDIKDEILAMKVVLCFEEPYRFDINNIILNGPIPVKINLWRSIITYVLICIFYLFYDKRIKYTKSDMSDRS